MMKMMKTPCVLQYQVFSHDAILYGKTNKQIQLNSKQRHLSV